MSAVPLESQSGIRKTKVLRDDKVSSSSLVSSSSSSSSSSSEEVGVVVDDRDAKRPKQAIVDESSRPSTAAAVPAILPATAVVKGGSGLSSEYENKINSVVSSFISTIKTMSESVNVNPPASIPKPAMQNQHQQLPVANKSTTPSINSSSVFANPSSVGTFSRMSSGHPNNMINTGSVTPNPSRSSGHVKQKTGALVSASSIATLSSCIVSEPQWIQDVRTEILTGDSSDSMRRSKFFSSNEDDYQILSKSGIYLQKEERQKALYRAELRKHGASLWEGGATSTETTAGDDTNTSSTASGATTTTENTASVSKQKPRSDSSVSCSSASYLSLLNPFNVVINGAVVDDIDDTSQPLFFLDSCAKESCTDIWLESDGRKIESEDVIQSKGSLLLLPEITHNRSLKWWGIRESDMLSSAIVESRRQYSKRLEDELLAKEKKEKEEKELARKIEQEEMELKLKKTTTNNSSSSNSNSNSNSSRNTKPPTAPEPPRSSGTYVPTPYHPAKPPLPLAPPPPSDAVPQVVYVPPGMQKPRLMSNNNERDYRENEQDNKRDRSNSNMGSNNNSHSGSNINSSSNSSNNNDRERYMDRDKCIEIIQVSDYIAGRLLTGDSKATLESMSGAKFSISPRDGNSLREVKIFDFNRDHVMDLKSRIEKISAGDDPRKQAPSASSSSGGRSGAEVSVDKYGRAIPAYPVSGRTGDRDQRDGRRSSSRDRHSNRRRDDSREDDNWNNRDRRRSRSRSRDRDNWGKSNEDRRESASKNNSIRSDSNSNSNRNSNGSSREFDAYKDYLREEQAKVKKTVDGLQSENKDRRRNDNNNNNNNNNSNNSSSSSSNSNSKNNNKNNNHRR